MIERTRETTVTTLEQKIVVITGSGLGRAFAIEAMAGKGISVPANLSEAGLTESVGL